MHSKKQFSSKKEKKKQKKKKDVSEEETLQQLQAGISSLSLKDAQEAVRLATASISRIKEEQRQAAEELKRAHEEVKKMKESQQKGQSSISTSINSNDKNDSYFEKSYWDSRYHKSASEASSTAEGSTIELYEWYLDFEELSHLLLSDIEHARNNISISSIPVDKKNAVGTILVSGCGNSSLCEDLYRAGCREVQGMDFSEGVIEAMNNRLQVSGTSDVRSSVHYFQANGTNMPKEMTEKFSAIVDKGTLDAIASGGEGSRNAQHAMLYMEEMWRILQTNGCLVVVSTMPPDLFYVVSSSIVPALKNELNNVANDQDVTQGHGYRINRLLTKEGGTVYYYALFKAVSKRDVKEYETILRETKEAMAALQEAQSEVERHSNAATLITKDIRDVEKKADGISAQLGQNITTGVISSVLNEAKGNDDKCNDNNSHELESLRREVDNLEHYSKLELKKTMSGNAEKSFQSSVDSSIPLSLPSFLSPNDDDPEVNLTITSSNLEAEGKVDVEFVISDGKWDEDDFISLLPFGAPTGENSDVFEIFEYTDKPKTVSDGHGITDEVHGKCQITLPAYGGPLIACYYRTFTTVTQKTQEDLKEGEELTPGDCIVSRSNKRLRSSRPFHVHFKVQKQWSRGGIGIQCRRMVLSRQVMTSDSLQSKELSHLDNMNYMVEDLQGIKVIAITVLLHPQSALAQRAGSGFNKVSTWIKSRGESNSGIILTLEADYGDAPCYCHIKLPNLPRRYHLHILDKASCAVENQDPSSGRDDLRSRIVIRIPYDLNATSTEDSSLGASLDGSDDLEAQLCCSLCSNVIIPTGKVHQVRQLPSGRFDHMMHEFLCSEDPIVPLSSVDMDAEAGFVLSGNIYDNINANDCTPSAVVFSCKKHPSMLDSLRQSPCGGGDLSEAAVSFIDTTTCAVTCGRCQSYLGDGRITEDESGTINTESDADVGNFLLSDVSSICFVRHRVRWSLSKCNGFSGAFPLLRSVCFEQVLAHLLTMEATLYGCSNFRMFVPHEPRLKLQLRVLSRSISDSFSTRCGYSLYVKPLNYGDEAESQDLMMKDALKISYNATLLDSKSSSGSVFRSIPLEFEDFEALKLLLSSREVWSSSSFQPNEKISFLLL